MCRLWYCFRKLLHLQASFDHVHSGQRATAHFLSHTANRRALIQAATLVGSLTGFWFSQRTAFFLLPGLVLALNIAAVWFLLLQGIMQHKPTLRV
jgi:hypothetical protein